MLGEITKIPPNESRAPCTVPPACPTVSVFTALTTAVKSDDSKVMTSAPTITATTCALRNSARQRAYEKFRHPLTAPLESNEKLIRQRTGKHKTTKMTIKQTVF